MSGKLRVVHYARESDAGAVETGDHLAQWARSRAASDEAGEIVVDTVIEQQSGAMIESRAVFLALLARAARGEIDAIRIDRLDRLGRGDAQAVLRYEARRAGALLLFNSPVPDESTTDGVIARLVDQLSSGMERIKIRDRFVGGKWARARAGRVLAVGKLVFGWRAVAVRDDRGRRTDTLVELVPDQIAVVRDMVRWTAEGRSARWICAKLAELGIPSPRGFDWRPSSVLAILRSTMLKGVWTYGRRETVLVDAAAGQRRKFVRWRTEGEVATVAVPGIMSAEEWDALQERIDKNRIDLFWRKPKRDYLMRGLITCALCGHKYAAISSVQYVAKDGTPSHYTYYTCGNKSPTNPCAGGRRKSQDVDAAVWAEVEKWLIERGDEGVQHMAKPDTASIDNAIEAAKRSEAEAEKRLRAVLREKVGRPDDDPALAGLAELEVEHSRAVRAARSRRKDAEGQREAALVAEHKRAELGDLRGALRARLALGGSHELRRAIVEALEVQAVYDPRTRTMTVASLAGMATIRL